MVVSGHGRKPKHRYHYGEDPQTPFRRPLAFGICRSMAADSGRFAGFPPQSSFRSMRLRAFSRVSAPISFRSMRLRAFCGIFAPILGLVKRRKGRKMERRAIGSRKSAAPGGVALVRLSGRIAGGRNPITRRAAPEPGRQRLLQPLRRLSALSSLCPSW